MTDLDLAALGFKCGLEIHQQLATDKLFCRCRTDAPDQLDDERADFRFIRRLRPTQSEMGEVDAAALTESRRARLFEYRGFHDYSCLVDADEEPPRPVSADALDVALTAALLLQARPIDEVQWMRKIVIDGSNTTGFQRTGLVAVGGRVGDVGLQSICLEEDSCRRIRDERDRTIWGLDRLGVPLIEIATEPEIRDGVHARAIALRIGTLLRSTQRVRRGLGTIRQDLNVSIREGTRVEIKGVQELNAIPKVIDWEVRRQKQLVDVRDALRKRGATSSDLAWSPADCTTDFADSKAKFVRKTLDANGVVLGHRLAGFHGLIGSERKEDPRLGRELSAHAKRDAGVSGILHGDELPGMGIEEAEVGRVRERLRCGPQDSFILVVEQRAVAERALKVALARAVRALDGVPGEVRMAEADATNSYLRPMPGSARMYPETDVPPTPSEPARLRRLAAALPPPPEEVVASLSKTHGLGGEESSQIVAEGFVADFERLSSAGGPSLAARVVLGYLPDLSHRYPMASARLLDWALQALAAVKAGRFAKEGVPVVLEALAKGDAASLEAAIAKAGLSGVDTSQVEERARALVKERADFVQARGLEGAGPLMGVLMKEFRGKVDGAVLNRVLAKEIERFLAK